MNQAFFFVCIIKVRKAMFSSVEQFNIIPFKNCKQGIFIYFLKTFDIIRVYENKNNFHNLGSQDNSSGIYLLFSPSFFRCVQYERNIY